MSTKLLNTQTLNAQLWSIDDEHYIYDSLHELLSSNAGELSSGDIVYVGDARYPSYSWFISACDIIESIKHRASDIGGEYADDFMSNVSEALCEFSEFLETWMKTHVTVSFCDIDNVREYALTDEDLM